MQDLPQGHAAGQQLGLGLLHLCLCKHGPLEDMAGNPIATQTTTVTRTKVIKWAGPGLEQGR